MQYSSDPKALCDTCKSKDSADLQAQPQLGSRLVRYYLWFHIIAGWFLASFGPFP